MVVEGDLQCSFVTIRPTHPQTNTNSLSLSLPLSIPQDNSISSSSISSISSSSLSPHSPYASVPPSLLQYNSLHNNNNNISVNINNDNNTSAYTNISSYDTPYTSATTAQYYQNRRY